MHVHEVPARPAPDRGLAGLGGPAACTPPCAGPGSPRCGRTSGEAAELAHDGSARRRRHRHRVGQEPGLPAAGADRRGRRGGARRPAAGRPRSTCPPPRRSPPTSWPGVRGAGRCPGVRAATYDGDTPTEERRWIRDHAQLVLTNPDLLHHSLLPGHERWAPFLRALRYVVVDECHVYRGVFGSHLAARAAPAAPGRRAVRRLPHVRPRLRDGARTPARHASRLVGLPVQPVTEDGSPRAAMTFALWEPGCCPAAASTRPPHRRSAVAETADLLADLVVDGVQTVAFARSRRGRGGRGRERPAAAGGGRRPRWASRWRPTAAATCPRSAAQLERPCASGGCSGWPPPTRSSSGSTSAAWTPCCSPAGRAPAPSLWQQAGGPGGRATRSLAVLVAADDPLDTYLVHHPEAMFGRPVEATRPRPATTPTCSAPHLAAAAAELPLTEADLDAVRPDHAGRWSTPSWPAGSCAAARAGGTGPAPTGPPTTSSCAGPGEVGAHRRAPDRPGARHRRRGRGARAGPHRRRLRAPGRRPTSSPSSTSSDARGAGGARRPRVDHPRPVGERVRHRLGAERPADWGPVRAVASARCDVHTQVTSLPAPAALR